MIEVAQGDLSTLVDSALETELRQLGVPEAEWPKVVAVIQTRISQHNYHLPDGPWIPFEAVSGIEALCPGFTQRYSDLLLERGRVVLARAEHEIIWEKAEQASQGALLRQGMNFGLAVAVLLIVGAVVCAALGAEKVGIALAGASALGMVGKFIDGRRNK